MKRKRRERKGNKGRKCMSERQGGRERVKKTEDGSEEQRKSVRQGYHQTRLSESTELLCILINLHICSPLIDTTQ